MTLSPGALQLIDRLRAHAAERFALEERTHRDVRLARDAGVSAEDIARALQMDRRTVSGRYPHT